MGLDLKPLITPSAASISELSNNIIAVDAYNAIYQFLATIRGPTGEPLANSKGEITSHLSGLFYRNTNLMMERIKPVYVFDGKANELKMAEIQRRSQLKKEATEKYQLAIEEGRVEDARKYGSRTAFLSDRMVEESK